MIKVLPTLINSFDEYYVTWSISINHKIAYLFEEGAFRLALLKNNKNIIFNMQSQQVAVSVN